MGWMRCTRTGSLAPLLVYLCGVVRAAEEGHGDCLLASSLVQAPRLPQLIQATLEKSWSTLDSNGTELVSALDQIPMLAHFPHARSTFGEHLVGTFALLALWGQPIDVCRCGLFHTGYSGDLFGFYVWDASSMADRSELLNIVGEEAEHLTWLFGTVHRGAIINLTDIISGHSEGAPLSSAPTDYVDVAHRLSGSVRLTNQQAAKLIVVTIADYLDQMVEVNGWRDHHQNESLSSELFPGDGKPAVALYGSQWARTFPRLLSPSLTFPRLCPGIGSRRHAAPCAITSTSSRPSSTTAPLLLIKTQRRRHATSTGR